MNFRYFQTWALILGSSFKSSVGIFEPCFKLTIFWAAIILLHYALIIQKRLSLWCLYLANYFSVWHTILGRMLRYTFHGFFVPYFLLKGTWCKPWTRNLKLENHRTPTLSPWTQNRADISADHSDWILHSSLTLRPAIFLLGARLA